MTFLEALAGNRPIRRTAPFGPGPWIVIGERYGLGSLEHPWIRIDTGKEITLARRDFEAKDWEVMP